MKILHITATHLNKYGGIPVVLDNLVSFQNEIDDVEARVLSVKASVSEINSPYFYFENTLKQIEEFLCQYNPDIIIFHSLYFKEYLEISKMIQKKGYSYFIEPHSSFGKAAQRKSKIKKKIANKFIFKRFIREANGFIFLNESEMEDSIYRTKKDIIIPNGIDIFLNPRFKNNEIKKLYFIGRFDISHKGLDLLIESLKELDRKKTEFIIDFFGTGTEKEINYINQNIAKFHYIKSKYKGPIYDEDKIRELSQYDIMILTSRYEGFPVTVLEALSYGCPCIVSDGTNVRDIIEENHLGWGCEKSNISETIEKALVEYDESAKEYNYRTIEFVKKHYNWRSIAESSVNRLNNGLNHN